jgi:lipopolysaccharide assembly outer membrane protein LptD (OstA)
MNHCVFRLAAISAITIISQAAVSQRANDTNPDEIKSVVVPMPKGIVRAEANNIDKEWNPRIVHLKGNAQVRIYTATKSPHGAIVMRADEVDLNETTGEILPCGDVRLTVEDINKLGLVRGAEAPL